MHKYAIYATYGWLTLSGTLHFVVDVLSQYLRGKRVPGPETTLYYGLNTTFSLSQVVFGLFGLFIAWRALPLLRTTPVLLLSLTAGLCWLAITFRYMGYWEPKLNAGLFCALVVVCFVTR
jgi:hypothetical protein